MRSSHATVGENTQKSGYSQVHVGCFYARDLFDPFFSSFFVQKRYGLSKFVLVAKHPCGIGVDRSIDCAVKLHTSAGDQLLIGSSQNILSNRVLSYSILVLFEKLFLDYQIYYMSIFGGHIQKCTLPNWVVSKQNKAFHFLESWG